MNNRIKIICIIFMTIIVLLPVTKIISQSDFIPDIKFRNITSKDGLSSNSVQCCLVDSYGFLWIGTQAGLNRYDGKTIKVYEHKVSDSNSISDNFVYSIFEDEENILWIGTLVGGLNRFDLKTGEFRSFKFNKSDSTSISNNTVFCIEQDKDENLWIATSKGLNKLDKRTFKFTRYFNNPSDSTSISCDGITAIYKDNSGNILVATKCGLNRYNPSSNNFSRIRFTENDNIEVGGVAQDESGNYWITTEGRGVFKYNEKSGNSENFMPDKITKNNIINEFTKSVVIDKNGLIWIGHLIEKSGIDIYDPKTNTFYNFRNDKNDDKSLCWDVVYRCYKDKYDNIYVCTNGGGLSCYNPYGIHFRHINKLSYNGAFKDIKVVWSMAHIYNRIWCFTEAMILSFTEYGELVKEYPMSVTNLKLFAPFLKTKENKLYIGIVGGGNILASYDEKKDMFFAIPVNFKYTEKPVVQTFAIFEDRNKNIWMATNSGLRLFDKDMNELEIFLHNDEDKNSIFGIIIRRIFQDSDGNIWFGGDGGLSKLEFNTRKFINYEVNYNSSDTRGGSRVFDIYEDNNKNLWFAYEDNGLDKYDMKTGKFKHFNTTSGLINNCIYGILPDNTGNLWFSTNKGLVKFNIETELFTNYDKSEGVQEDEFNVDAFCSSNDGMLIFGGTNGINCFYPDKIQFNPRIPPLALTSFKVFDKEINLPENINVTEEIKLSYKDNFFTIYFAALDYANPSKNKYAYMLEGIDEDWVKSGNVNEAKYTDISPGEYIFRVKGSNNDGIWNEEGKAIKIIITPPWWGTYWFKGFMIILFILVVGYIFRKRISIEKKKHKEKEEFAKQLIESQEKERNRIASELHDSLAQSLLVIKNKAMLSIRGPDESKKLKNDMKDITEGISETMEEVRTISRNLRPYELERFGLTATIEILIEKIRKSSDINFTFNHDDIKDVLEKKNEINLFRIIQECLNNIIKHSEAQNANVSILKSERNLYINIKDDGKGIDFEKLLKTGSSGFGIKGITERVYYLDGNITFNSKPDKGTEINIKIPLNQ